MKNIKRKTKPDWNKLTAEDLQKLEIAEEIGVIDKIYSDRKSVVYGKSVDLGGRRIIKKK